MKNEKRSGGLDTWGRGYGVWSCPQAPVRAKISPNQKGGISHYMGCKSFSDYLFGREFWVETDHKPLVTVISTKDLSELPLSTFCAIIHSFVTSRHGMITADALSRSPADLPDPDSIAANGFVDPIMSGMSSSSSKLNQNRSLYCQYILCTNVIIDCETWS